MDYKIKAVWSKGNGHMLTIIGLKYDDIFDEKTLPDTELVLMGMESTCDTTKKIMKELHRILYDEFQTSNYLKDGDTFELPSCSVFKYFSYEGTRIKLPNAKFYCYGVHVLNQYEYDYNRNF